MADVLISLGTASLGVALFLLYVLYKREQHVTNRLTSERQDDLTNMIILFQTMRDLVRQQKELARNLNATLDKKVAIIRKAISETLDTHQRLVAQQRTLTRQLEDIREELASVQRQVGYVKEPSTAIPGEQAISEEPVEHGTPPPPALNLDDAQPTGPGLEVVVRPQENGDAEDDFDAWVGLDLGEARSDPYALEEVEPLPEAPEDPAAARQAFKALLDMGEGPPPSATHPAGPGPSPKQRASGRGGVTPVQARVYEYSDAGMSVPQIARELGVPKGEVRLILSLRKDKER